MANLGPELIQNGNFSAVTFDVGKGRNVPDFWSFDDTVDSIWTVANDMVTSSYNTTDYNFKNYGSLSQDLGSGAGALLKQNSIYLVSFTIGGGNVLPSQYLYVALGEIQNLLSTQFVVPMTNGRVSLIIVAHKNVVPNPEGVQSLSFWTEYSTASLSLTDVSVREILDGLILGDELATNGTFVSNANGWTLGANWSYDTNKITKTAGAGTAVSQVMGIEANKFYYVTVHPTTTQTSLSDYRVNFDGIFYSDALDPLPPVQDVVSNFVIPTRADGVIFTSLTTDLVTFDVASDFTGSLEYISVREILGFDNNLYLQNTFMVGSSPDGTVQTVNAGKSDDGTPIYYELETQEIDFSVTTSTALTVNNISTSNAKTEGSRLHLKKISDKIVVFANNAIDSTLEASQDGEYKTIPMDLSGRVNIGQDINLEGHYFTFKWSGTTSENQPILESISLESIEDLGMTYG